MKKVSCALLAGCLLLLCACGAPAPNTPPQKVPELLRVMAPSQGGEMLYPVYYEKAEYLWLEDALWNPQEKPVKPVADFVMGLINQNGEVVAPAQYHRVLYYPNAQGQVQYIIAAGKDGQCVVYRPDGSVHDRFAGLYTRAEPGIPYLLVVLQEPFGDFYDQRLAVYSLAEKKLLFESGYQDIQFVDSHTLLLSWMGSRDNDAQGIVAIPRDELYDLNTGTLKQAQGFLLAILSEEELQEHITHLPAIREYSWEKTKPEGYFTRDGKWTDTLPKGAVLPKERIFDEEPHEFVPQIERVVGGYYKWKETAEYQGYVDEAGEWVWREARQYAFLED